MPGWQVTAPESVCRRGAGPVHVRRERATAEVRADNSSLIRALRRALSGRRPHGLTPLASESHWRVFRDTSTIRPAERAALAGAARIRAGPHRDPRRGG